MDNKDNLLGVLRTIFRWKKTILYICLATGIGCAIVTWFFLDNYYEATSVFYAASPDLAQPEPVGPSIKERDYYGEEEDVDRILTIAESSQVANHLINKFKLYEHYDIDTTEIKAPFFVAKTFQKLYNVKKTKFDAIEISVEDKDITYPAPMINEARNKINQIAQTLVKQSQRAEMISKEKNIEEKQVELTIINDSLANMRRKYGIYNSKTQGEILAKLSATAESTLALNKARRDALQKKGGIYRDTVSLLNALISGQEQQVIDLSQKLQLFNDGLSLVTVLEQLHEEASENLSLSSERFKHLKAAYEADVTTLYLVEAGAEPIVKSRPKRSIICIVSTLIAFLFTVIGVLLVDTYKDVNWREIFDGRES